MQKIVPHLWYDKEAKEAATFYVSLFENSKLLNVNVLENTPSGDAELVDFELAGLQFQAISAGPYFKFNPSISLMVACESVEEVDTKWGALLEGGMELMPLGEYPFNKRYGWLQDRYGLSWQLMLIENNLTAQKITPNLLFSGDSCGKTEEALTFYTELFTNSGIEFISKYGPGKAATPKAKINYAAFKLSNLSFSAMDNGNDVDFNFNEAFSLIVKCQDQHEIDYFWDKLSAVPEAEQCGWVKDKYGVSWQIVPDNIDEILSNGSKDEIQKINKELLKMKKIDIDALEKARIEKG
ncbi:MAG TPA: VOC family protein [Ureibacillus sp.]|nr:VOC family protein [Ureibacillus sp.]